MKEWTQATPKTKNIIEFKAMARVWLLYSFFFFFFAHHLKFFRSLGIFRKKEQGNGTFRSKTQNML